jgi:uncharacterized protein (DUF983 family)
MMLDEPASFRPPRNTWRAMLRGFAQRCPSCGQAGLFGKYLKVRDACQACGEDLHHHRADDAPAYFTIVIVGHIIVGGVLILERGFAPPTWLHAVVWLPLTLAVTLLLLPRIKGALVGLQWALCMHGFGGSEPMPEDRLTPGAALPRSAAASDPPTTHRH